MKAKGIAKRDGARERGAEGARRRLVVSFLIVGSVLAVALSSRAHEPITTKVRFNKEVIRILQRSCLGCHRPGGIAFSLATYDEARPWAKAIKEEVLEKRMPPWNSVKGYGEFRNAPPFTQRDVDLLVNWVEGGAPKGDDKDSPEGPLFSDDWQLGKPDLVLKPEIASSIDDEHRSVSFAPRLKEDRWLTAIDFKPGDSSVHCATFYLLQTDVASKPGEPVIDFIPVRLATWMPGQKTVPYGDGVAQFLPAGSSIGVFVHYRDSEKADKDTSAVGLYFSKTPPRKRIQRLEVTGSDAIIPVGAEPHPFKAYLTLQNDSEAIAIRPCVNPLIVSLQATVYRPDGSREVLIWTRGYQSDWEPTYYFKRTVPLPAGTRVEVIAYFDNSEDNQNNPNNPPKPFRWSEPSPLCVLLGSVNISAADAATR